MEAEKLRYPIGKFQVPDSVDDTQRQAWIGELAAIPDQLRSAVSGLNDKQLDTPYRPGGWTVRQVVHHLADASLNQYTRMKLALTEDNPTVKPFEEEGWAALTDSKQLPITPSLSIVDGLYARWINTLEAISAEDFARTFLHPANGPTNLDTALGMCVWHGRHHIAHITSLRQRENW